MKKLLTVVLILLIIILAVAGAGVCGAYRVSQLDVNYPNLSVNGIAVGGLTKAQTAEALNAGGWEARVSTPLTVTTLAGQSFTVDPLQSGVLQTAEGIADMAYAYGRQGNLIENFISYLRPQLKQKWQKTRIDLTSGFAAEALPATAGWSSTNSAKTAASSPAPCARSF